MAALTEIFVPVRPDMDRFPNEVKAKLRKIDASNEGKAVAGRFGVGFNGAFGGIMKHSAGLFVGAFAAIKGAQVFGGFIKDAAESAKVSRLTAAAIKSTGGAAKITADQVGDLATAISNKTGADDETIQSGANLLLTFTGIRNEVGKGNDIFNQAAATVTDMAAALNGGEVSSNGVKSASIQLGKALNDPIKGVTALSKVGVSFTQDQKDQIKTLVESGKTMDAQKIILAELQKEFGGAAAAAGDPFVRLKTIVGNLGEELGGFVLPIAEKFAGFLTGKAIPAVSALANFLKTGDFTAAFREAFNVEEDSGFVKFLTGVRDIAGKTFKEIRGGIIAFGSAWKANDGDITSSGFPGFMERLANTAHTAFDFFKSEVLPRLKEFAGFIVGNVVPAVGNLIASIRPLATDVGTAVIGVFQQLVPVIKDIGNFIGSTLVPKIVDLTKWLKDNSTVVGAVAVGIGAMIVAVKAYNLAITVGTAAVKAYTVVTQILDKVMKLSTFGIIITLVIGVAAALVYAYKKSETFRNIVNGVWNAVSTAAQVAFDWIKNAAVTVFNWFVTGWTVVDKILTTPFTLAKAGIDIVWSGIKSAAETLYSWFVTGWTIIQTVITKPFELARDGIGTAWTAVKTAAQQALAWVVRKFLDFAQSILDTAAHAFSWVPGLDDKLQTAATAFGKFRDSVNEKLGGINDQEVNVTADLKSWGTPELLAAAHGRAEGGPGGPVRGPGSTTSDTAGLFALSNKEWVIKAASSQMYGDRAMKSVNDGTATIIPGFATGGRAGLLVAPHLPSERQQQQAAGGVVGAVAAIGREMAPVMAKIMAKALGINPALNKVLDYVRSQVGKPYVWGGVGPGGYDCSGLVSAAVNVARGKSPNSRVGATGSMPWAGMVAGPGAFEIGWFQGNPGHTAATVNKVNIESAGGVGVRMGSGARGARDAMFTNRAHLKGFAGGGSVGRFLNRVAPSRHELHLQHLAHLAHAEHLAHLAHLLTGGTEGGFIGARARIRGDAPFDLIDPRGNRFIGKRALRDLGIEDFDTGGRWRSGTLGVNLSGKTETVVPADGVMTVALSNEDRRLLRSVRDRAITLDGRRIDEAFGRGALGGGY